MRRTAGTGLLATVAAMAATTLGAALARDAGVSFQLPGAAEPIPVAGVGVMTGFFAVVGIVLAAALLRWSARPAQRFVQVAVALTAVSLVPPVLTGAEPATVVTLMALHLVAAAVMIPALSRSLARARPDPALAAGPSQDSPGRTGDSTHRTGSSTGPAGNSTADGGRFE